MGATSSVSVRSDSGCRYSADVSGRHIPALQIYTRTDEREAYLIPNVLRMSLNELASYFNKYIYLSGMYIALSTNGERRSTTLLTNCFGFLEPTFIIQASVDLRGECDISNMSDFTLDSLDLRENFGVSTAVPSYCHGF